jgi:hypothetical protein
MISMPMAKDKLEEEEKEPVMVATGPAGPIPHASYCTPQCYEKGKRERRNSCECRGCDGDAHGLGMKYAFDQGYLKDSPFGPRKPKPGQVPLFSEEDLIEAVIIDQPQTEQTPETPIKDQA